MSGCAVERLGVRRLRLGLEVVVELVGGAGLQLGHERLDVEPGEDGGDAAGEPGDLAQVAHQRLAGAGVLHLDRDLALLARRVVEPPAAVDLTDGGGGRGRAVEPHQALGPVGAEVGGELLAHGRGRHRRCGVLERGEVLAVGGGDVLGQRGLEDAQRLAELHRPALELAQGAEELLGRALLHLGEHRLRGPAAQPLAEAHGLSSGVAQREGCEPGGARGGLAGELGHGPIVVGPPNPCVRTP